MCVLPLVQAWALLVAFLTRLQNSGLTKVLKILLLKWKTCYRETPITLEHPRPRSCQSRNNLLEAGCDLQGYMFPVQNSGFLQGQWARREGGKKEGLKNLSSAWWYYFRWEDHLDFYSVRVKVAEAAGEAGDSWRGFPTLCPISHMVTCTAAPRDFCNKVLPIKSSINNY